MHYTIKHAETDTLSILLDRIGNRYTASIWSKTAHRIMRSEDFSKFDAADNQFSAWCYNLDAEPHEVEREPSEFQFD